ncbi:MAG: D-alanine--D-alanine ligase [Melioribacteraceae bacterium]|nr:D-alanine--D-alanine ligase [Melioribacteraceae bacterium]
MNNKNINVALFAGGTSPEREVSKMTSSCIYNSLIKLGFNVKVLDPAYGLNQPKEHQTFFENKDLFEICNKNCLDLVNSNLLNDIDLVFLGLHGTNGEDGTMQSLLEFRGIKYTGSKVLASALAMDKSMSKSIFRDHNVLTADWLTVSKDYYERSIREKITSEIGFPCIIKPNDGGSTIGLTVCKSENQIDEALKLAFKYCSKVIVEKFIKGRELTVGIIGERVFPVLEIKPKHSLYDYECKYSDGMSEYEVPAKILEHVSEKLIKTAFKAYKSLCCEGYGRVDFILDENDNAYCLEVNTLPGLTTHSLLPKVAAADNMNFNEVIKSIINEALK